MGPVIQLCARQLPFTPSPRCVHGTGGPGPPAPQVDHQVQLPGPARALREEHCETGGHPGPRVKSTGQPGQGWWRSGVAPPRCCMAWTTSIPSARSSTQTSSRRTSCCVWVTPTSGAWLLRPQSGSNQGHRPRPALQVRACVGLGLGLGLWASPLPESLFLSPPPLCPSYPTVSNAPQVTVSWSTPFPVHFPKSSKLISSASPPPSALLQWHFQKAVGSDEGYVQGGSCVPNCLPLCSREIPHILGREGPRLPPGQAGTQSEAGPSAPPQP